MIKHEYQFVIVPHRTTSPAAIKAILNKMGNEGWEFVGALLDALWFKRTYTEGK